jgi:hypothetical protein
LTEDTRFLAALARTSLRYGRIPAIFNGRVCYRESNNPALDANRSGHFSYLDCPQYSHKQLIVSASNAPFGKILR